MSYIFRYLVVIILLLESNIWIHAQNFHIDRIKNPSAPLVFEHPENSKILLLFTPEKMGNEANPICQIFEGNEKYLDSLRKTVVRLRIPSSNDDKLRRLCHASRSDYGYFAIENNNGCRVFRVSWLDLSITLTDSLKAMQGERFLQGVSDNNHAYIIGFIANKKKPDHLLIYEIDESGTLKKHDFVVPENEKKTFEKIFVKPFKLADGSMFSTTDTEIFRPLSVKPNMEEDPEKAGRRPKLFAGKDLVWMALDDEDDDEGNQLKLYQFNLQSDTITHRKYLYGNGSLGRGSKGGTYLFDGKIFQVASSASTFQLTIRDLWTGNLLQNTQYGNADTIDFANSPVMVPGRGILGIEKELSTTKKFLKRYKKCTPSIQVRLEGNEYLMCIGGYEHVKKTTGSGFNPSTGAFTGSSGYSYERAFSFYTAVNNKNYFRSTNRFKRTLASYHANMSVMLDNSTDEAILLIGNNYYLGQYNTKTDTYNIRKLRP